MSARPRWRCPNWVSWNPLVSPMSETSTDGAGARGRAGRGEAGPTPSPEAMSERPRSTAPRRGEWRGKGLHMGPRLSFLHPALASVRARFFDPRMESSAIHGDRPPPTPSAGWPALTHGVPLLGRHGVDLVVFPRPVDHQ